MRLVHAQGKWRMSERSSAEAGYTQMSCSLLASCSDSRSKAESRQGDAHIRQEPLSGRGEPQSCGGTGLQPRVCRRAAACITPGGRWVDVMLRCQEQDIWEHRCGKGVQFWGFHGWGQQEFTRGVSLIPAPQNQVWQSSSYGTQIPFLTHPHKHTFWGL